MPGTHSTVCEITDICVVSLLPGIFQVIHHFALHCVEHVVKRCWNQLSQVGCCSEQGKILHSQGLELLECH
jgi:hypothetical protein